MAWMVLLLTTSMTMWASMILVAKFIYHIKVLSPMAILWICDVNHLHGTWLSPLYFFQSLLMANGLSWGVLQLVENIGMCAWGRTQIDTTITCGDPMEF
jgi:hypothetical protein